MSWRKVLERVNIFILIKVPCFCTKNKASSGEISLKYYPVNPSIPFFLMSHTLKLAAKTYKTPNNSTAVKKVYVNLKISFNLYPDMFNNVSSLLRFEMNASLKWAVYAFRTFGLLLFFRPLTLFYKPSLTDLWGLWL